MRFDPGGLRALGERGNPPTDSPSLCSMWSDADRDAEVDVEDIEAEVSSGCKPVA